MATTYLLYIRSLTPEALPTLAAMLQPEYHQHVQMSRRPDHAYAGSELNLPVSVPVLEQTPTFSIDSELKQVF